MMNLQDLVPPLYLCKLIPEGEFEESVLCWIDFRGVYPGWNYRDPGVVVRETAWAATSKKGVYPAPTLQEIMYDLPQGVELSRDSEWFCSLDMTNEYYDNTTATAALKVWMKKKGFQDE